MPRTYDDPCGLARALNLVGERWSLLIVRELLLGPKRFTDLRRGLPSASQSVLTQRLGELEQAGVLCRRELGPPVSGRVYELTGWGRELEPALLTLSTWGSRAPLPPAGPELSVDALALALRTTFDGSGADDVICEFRLDGDVLTVTVTGGRLEVTRGPATRPAAIVEAGAAGLRSVIFGKRSWADGGLTVSGDRAALTRLLGCFSRPAPARG
jgi:DNA-binding HxlR family transcriptional regulator